jgi:hypothetical protein
MDFLKDVRSFFIDSKKTSYYSVVDFVAHLFGEHDLPGDRWRAFKFIVKSKDPRVLDRIIRIRAKSKKNGKFYQTDFIDFEGLLLLAQLATNSPRIREIRASLAKIVAKKAKFIPGMSKRLQMNILTWRRQGRSDAWIDIRVRALLNKKEYDYFLANRGVINNWEVARLVNTVYVGWSKLIATQYKALKGLKRTDKLRNHMSVGELNLTLIAEFAAMSIAEATKADSFESHKTAAEKGSAIALATKLALEKETNIAIVNSNNLFSDGVGTDTIEKPEDK